jgi:hypothetical protein
MKNAAKKAALGVCAAALVLPSAALAAPWTKTYVVEWYEPAFLYGAATGVSEPGSDCPGGNPEPDWIKELVASGYTVEEAKWLRDPQNPTRSPVHGQAQMAFRGKDHQNVYLNPTSTPESGFLKPVSGTVAEGLNLDGDASTGFTSPTGEKGIDNNFYRALGCWKTYRGPPRKSSGAEQFNDAMRQGSWTIVVVMSGKGADPLNDNDVQIGFYASDDKVVKDANGAIAHDYSFSIAPDAKYEAILKGKTVKGVVTARAEEAWLRDAAYNRDLQLLKPQVRFEIQPDGALKGLIGGYRPWLPVYQGWVAGRGPVIEALTWVRLPDVYYALRRAADYSPAGPGGDQSHISFAMRLDAVPAFVTEPDASRQVAQVKSYKALAMAKKAAPADKPAGAKQAQAPAPAKSIVQARK